ncbi:O-methyltransferase [Yersinia enterocolitica]|nr:hypothetical protein [Yersinia enterocolitica]EKN5067310.1 hypothetical protein [Yersinia enterocolitica]HDL7459282.1 hypothetical protein [Yersinia enterocolitica]HDL7862533.1 hypothetical protein [Yersinia enterocolitica]HEB1981942.1 hypothetical protein [Yersinia enterocolitica]
MSSGGSIPYHLRPNKAVDRNLFIDMLYRINNFSNISEYTYISFGGPFLEDFKQVHNSLKIEKMLSIELVDNVHKRQAFNMPLSCVDIGTSTEKSSEFLQRHEFQDLTIIWLDFVSPSELTQQLDELSFLISKLNHKDIFKITVNAHVETLGKSSDPAEANDPRPYRLTSIRTKIEDRFLPDTLSIEDVSTKNYPKTLLASIHRAIKIGLSGRPDITVQPLSSFVYSDGMTMLTASGIVLNNNQDTIDQFFINSRLENWKFMNKEWSEPKSINIPSMSIKERMIIEAMLPNTDADKIRDKLGFFIGDKESESKRLMNNFIEYYKVMPWYSKVVV